MIRHPFLHLSLLLALCTYAVPTVSAAVTDKSAKAAKADKADKKGKKKGKKPKEEEAPVIGAVGQYLQGLDDSVLWVNEKPAADADFYIYLTTASWCGPCNAEMPHVVEHYKKMRELGNVELIVVSGDRDPNAAKGFMEKYGASFAVYDRKMARELPGYTPSNGIPDAIIVDKDGNVIKQGHGAIINQWEALTVNNPEYAGKISAPKGKEDDAKGGKGKKEAKDAKEGNAVIAALRRLKPFNAKPSAKADYYIYLQSASWCGPCNNEMPRVVEAYKEMKKTGRVEIILVSHDKTEGDAKGFLKQYRAKFPAVMVQEKDIEKLPGFSKPNGIPNAIFVDKNGRLIVQGHGSLIEDWKQYTIDADSAE